MWTPENPLASTLARKRHGRAHRANRKRRADACGMTANQVDLQRRQIALVDARFREVAEAGVDAVDRSITASRCRRQCDARRSHDRARPA